MELNGIARFALIVLLIGMIVGIGVLILDRMSTSPSLYNDVTVSGESFTWPANATNVSLAHGNITTFTRITNASGTTLAAANYTVFAEAGIVKALQNTTICKTGASCLAYYEYEDRNTKSTQALAAARDALADLATSWLGLIVLIGALSVILVMVIRSFANQGGTR